MSGRISPPRRMASVERRAQRADGTEGRRADEQRRGQRHIGLWRQIEEQRHQRRQDGEGQTRGQPVRGDLGGGERFQRQRREREEIEAAVLEIGLEETVERQQAGQHRGDPEHAAGDAAEQLEVGADAQRYQRGDGGEEGERQERAAAARARRGGRRGRGWQRTRSCGTEGEAGAGGLQRFMRGGDGDAAGGRHAFSALRSPAPCLAHRARRAARRAATAGAPRSAAAPGQDGASGRRKDMRRQVGGTREAHLQ